MVRSVGIGPTTIGLKGHCSTTELRAPTSNMQILTSDSVKAERLTRRHAGM